VLKGKKILIAITGSIAAYKIPLLVRQLIKQGAEVKVIMTQAATDFVSNLTFSVSKANPINN
jgi:phosphopantothenoylcysteine decarboxylase/phosphopantothenate--cysteine ligase